MMNKQLLETRELLSDCRFCLDMLEKEQNERRFKIILFAFHALCRAIGDQIKRECAHLGKEKMSNDLYTIWRQEPIYRDFIKSERDSVLHDYKFSTEIVEEIPLVLSNAGNLHFSKLEGDFYRPWSGVYRSGDDVRDICSEALVWWERRIVELEEAIFE